MKLKIAFIIIFLVGLLQAQTFDFVQSHAVGGLNTSRLASSIDLDSENRAVVGRMISNNLNYNYAFGDFVLEKLDVSGNVLWSDTLSGNVRLRGLLVDRNDDIYTYGDFRDSLDVTGLDYPLSNTAETHSWIAKFNSGGQLSWITNVHLSTLELQSVTSICEGQDGIWVSTTAGLGISEIHKMESGGALTTIISQENVGSAMSMSVDPFGGLWVTGPTSMGPQSYNGYAANAPFSYNQYIVRYANDGVALWVNFIEDVTAENQQIVTDQNGFAYYGTGLRDDFMFGDIPSQGPDWVFDFAITRLDSNGNFLWLREVPLDDQLGDGSEGLGTFLAVGADNSVYFSGFTRSTIDWGSGVLTEADVYNDILILNFASDGQILWGKTAGGEYQDSGDAISVDPLGNLWVTGRCGETASFDSIEVSGAFTNAYVARLSVNPTSQESVPSLLPQMKLEGNHPNPFNPTTQVNYSIGEGTVVDLRVYDVTGREVGILVSAYIGSGSHSVSFDSGNLPAGVYFYRLSTHIGVETRKMLLVK